MRTCISDEYCKPGYSCKHGLCKILTQCSTNTNCKFGLECKPPHCDVTNSQDITAKSQAPNGQRKSNFKNSFHHKRILIKDCDCYLSFKEGKHDTNEAATIQTLFKNRRVNRSFCSPVRKRLKNT